MSLTNVRKIFTALAQVVPGLLCIVLVYSGCNVVLVLVVWFTAVTLITAAYAGAMANVVDIAPNFAGPVLAFAQTIHMTASFLSPLAAGYLTQDGVRNNIHSYRILSSVTSWIFIIVRVLCCILMYVCILAAHIGCLAVCVWCDCGGSVQYVHRVPDLGHGRGNTLYI